MLACTVEARVLLSRTTLSKNLNASLTASAVGNISANHLPFLAHPSSSASRLVRVTSLAIKFL